jgi:hypothetical protein
VNEILDSNGRILMKIMILRRHYNRRFIERKLSMDYTALYSKNVELFLTTAERTSDAIRDSLVR